MQILIMLPLKEQSDFDLDGLLVYGCVSLYGDYPFYGNIYTFN